MKKVILSLVLTVAMILGSTVITNAATKTWDLENLTAGEVNVQGTTGEYDGLLIDATDGGKFYSRGGDVQFNSGTKVSIPVNGPCEIEVKAYTSDITIGGKTTENGITVNGKIHVYNYEGEAGYVDLVSTGSNYLYYITVTEPEDPSLAPVYTYWNLTTDGGYTTTYNGTVGEYNGLVIDATATNAKLAPSATYAQFNANTVIEIPVIGSSKIEVVAHDSSFADKFTFDGNPVGNSSSITKTDAKLVYDYVGDAGTVKLSASENTYIISIRVTATIQTIGAQTQTNDNSVLGFVTLVSKAEYDANSANISEMGIIVKNSANPTTAELTLENVTADGAIRKIVTNYVTDVTVLDSTKSDDHTYAFRSVIKGISDTAKTYTAVPYITYTNGTTVYGAEVTRSVEMVEE